MATDIYNGKLQPPQERKKIVAKITPEPAKQTFSTTTFMMSWLCYPGWRFSNSGVDYIYFPLCVHLKLEGGRWSYTWWKWHPEPNDFIGIFSIVDEAYDSGPWVRLTLLYWVLTGWHRRQEGDYFRGSGVRPPMEIVVLWGKQQAPPVGGGRQKTNGNKNFVVTNINSRQRELSIGVISRA